ncbi:MAG: DUF3995 domain-containing protein [Flammeovirgaceae bacterium]
MNTITGILATIILCFLSFIHVYWAFGGERWIDLVIPQAGQGGPKMLSPTTGITLVIAFILLAMAGICIAVLYFQAKGQVPKLISVSAWAISILFLLRAIGEFKYVGFFKQVADTPFAHYDTLVYSPLCVVIALLIIGTLKL